MFDEVKEDVFKALPVQLIDLPDGVLVKRGCTEFRINGSEARSVLETILAAAFDKGATREEIFALFPPDARSSISDLIEHLSSRRILLNANQVDGMKDVEDSVDIFYWHFDKHTEQIVNRINVHRLAIVGMTRITRQLVSTLVDLNLNNFEIIDYPPLRNFRLFSHDATVSSNNWPSSIKSPLDYKKCTEELQAWPFDCTIVTSDFGYSPALSEWNRFCIGRRLHFLPVVLRHMIGYVGPFVIPGETACLECLHARQNAHMSNYRAQRASEEEAYEGQIVTGFHPSMASVLGDIAAFELTRFYSQSVPKPQIGTLIEVNLLDTGLKSRKVLKVPRCPVCSPLCQRSSLNPYTSAFTASSDENT